MIVNFNDRSLPILIPNSGADGEPLPTANPTVTPTVGPLCDPNWDFVNQVPVEFPTEYSPVVNEIPKGLKCEDGGVTLDGSFSPEYFERDYPWQVRLELVMGEWNRPR